MSDQETRPAKTLSVSRAHARTTALIQCPFCLRSVRAYVWSLAGSGKRCECGALLHGDGIGNAAATRKGGKR